jgi:hypothetical protein
MVQIGKKRPRACAFSAVRFFLWLSSTMMAVAFFLRMLLVPKETTVIKKSEQWFQPYRDVHSDFVELQHCNLTLVDRVLFESKAVPLWKVATDAMVLSDDASLELKAELLEHFVTFERLCNFTTYRPSVSKDVAAAAIAGLSASAWTNLKDSVRLVFCISAFQDAEQVVHLVNALPTEQTLVIIHLERSVDDNYHRELSRKLPKALILRFGSVVYRTDSLTAINIRILRWLTFDMNLPYEYVVLMDGSAFPLLAPDKWISHLSASPVWLGELTHQGKRVAGSSTTTPFLHQRLIHSSTKQHKRLSGSTWKSNLETFPWSKHLRYKSISGNQGAYQKTVITQLLQSDDVMELFALSKYACCCCVEEKNWIAAMSMIGYLDKALSTTSVFQLWGGNEECGGSMSNVVLSLNSTLCYRTEDPLAESMYVRGNQTMEMLRRAKRHGVLFARKFRSLDHDSIQLMNDIRAELWASSP